MADLTREVAESHVKAPHQTGASATEKQPKRKSKRTLGGKGSGNFGHEGRPGAVGGSTGRGNASTRRSNGVDRLIGRMRTWGDEFGASNDAGIALNVDGVKIVLSERPEMGDNVAYIGMMQAEDMQQGLGTAMMKRITELADRYNVVLALESHPYKHEKSGKKIPADKLKAFYERFGFKADVPNKDGITFMFRDVVSERALGGKGSGNHGHKGRPGEVGGSSSSDNNVVGMNSPAFKAWFKNSKVVDSNGDPLVVYHGSTHDIESFLPAGHAKLNAEGDWGAGIYFTNDREDVSENYAGEGPDLTSRIEQRVEQILAERDDSDPSFFIQEDLDAVTEEAEKQARAELVGKAGAVALPVYLSLQDPFVLGDGNQKESYLDSEFEYADPDDSESDIVGKKGKLPEFIQAFNAITSEYEVNGMVDGHVQNFIGSLQDRTSEGVSARELDKLFRDSDLYISDDSGRIVNKEVFRRALEQIGFDGVIDYTVNDKFGIKLDGYGQPKLDRTGNVVGGMKGLTSDSVHYVAFKPTQVKSAIGNKGTYDPNNPLITLAAWVPETLVHEAADAFVTKYADAVSYAFNIGKSAVNRATLRNAKTVDTIMSALEPGIKATAVALGKSLPEVGAGVVGAGGFAGVEMLRRDRVRVASIRTLADKKKKKSGLFAMEFDYTNPDVLEWAEQHAAELIAGIDKTTRKKIRQYVVDALDSGSLDDLETQLIPLLGDRERAELIAHTETMAAANEGQRQSWEQAIEEGYLEAGLIREWIATADEVTCPVCNELNGKRTKLDGLYPNGGGDGPPAHPRCRCTEGIVG